MRRDLGIFDEDNAAWRAKKKRVPWDQRLELIEKEFPGLRQLDANVLLRDEAVFARLVRDILKVDQMEPGRAGPRPNIDYRRGMQAWQEWTGRDFAKEPFLEAFRQLTNGQSFTQVARKTHLSRSRVYRLLRGQEQPTVDDLRTIASAYGKKPAYFAEYRAEYLIAAFAARVATETDLTVALYLKLVRS